MEPEIKPLNTRHIHVAGTTAGLPIDKCAVCGRDGLDPIHIRYPDAAVKAT